MHRNEEIQVAEHKEKSGNDAAQVADKAYARYKDRHDDEIHNSIPFPRYGKQAEDSKKAEQRNHTIACPHQLHRSSLEEARKSLQRNLLLTRRVLFPKYYNQMTRRQVQGQQFVD